jgi:hypothetical protein
MNQRFEKDRTAIRQAFLWHLATFAWVMALLGIIDLVLTGTDNVWVHWVAIIWGGILGVHFLDAFVFGGFLGFHGACWAGRVDTVERRNQGKPTA